MKGYDIKIRLNYMRPITWRDLIIPENLTFKELHKIIQVVYGSYDFDNLGHLHHFVLPDSTRIMDPSLNLDYWDEDILDHNTTYIDEYFKKLKKIEYEYDFGDGWDFNIEIKKIVDYDKPYPIIKRYKGEYNILVDCGGVGGLMDLIELVDNPEYAEDYQKEELKYLETFDLEEAQEELINLFNNNAFI